MPPYFQDRYSAVRLPIAEDESPGLRRGQLGAIHSLVGHFTLRRSPAIVVMPTGSGKTGVLMLAPFLLRCRRALIVTPSKLVRNQVATDFAELRTLKSMGALPTTCDPPRVHEVLGTIKTRHDWIDLESADVVIGTPNSCSPQYEGIPEPPADLFDILLIDEAHHSAASTWAQLMSSFGRAQQALFTATPFRRDRREIPGSFVFNYPLREARADGVFGELHYHPVVPPPGVSSDVAIAQAVEAAIEEDRRNGYNHSAMIRANSRARARELLTLYQDRTSLRLDIVHGGLTDSTVQRVLRRLRNGDLDGVVCVNMMGEGFDFPQLKVAGLHAPHQSLGVTLQFIGRFARTGGGTLGPARFFAVPDEIEGESERLFREDAIWSELVPELAQDRIDREEETRRVLATLQEDALHHPLFEDLSPYSLRPAFHTKVYATSAPVTLDEPPHLPSPYAPVLHRTSDDGTLAITIAHARSPQRWCNSSLVAATDFELVVTFYHEESSLFFICCSRGLRSVGVYEGVASTYTAGEHRILPLYQLGRLLGGLNDVRCHSIGMRNRMRASNTESYRIIAATRAERSLRATDGRLFHRGHVDCSAIDRGTQVTLGYSSASKAWSKSSGTVPALVTWCRTLAERMSSDTPPRAIPGLEYLASGQPLQRIPPGAFGIDWDASAYDEDVVAVVPGEQQPRPLCTLDLSVEAQSDGAPSDLIFRVGSAGHYQRFRFRPSDGRLINDLGGDFPVSVREGQSDSSLIDYLNAQPPTFYFADLSTARGVEYFPNTAGVNPLDDEQLLPLTWSGVDITSEFPAGGTTLATTGAIHDFLRDDLLNDHRFQAIIYDHRTGELADFIAVGETDSAVLVNIYHCKASTEANPGSRVADLYEVSGQVVKSLHLIHHEDRLKKHIRDRTNDGSVFFKGDLQGFNQLLSPSRQKPIKYQLVIVQPGLSKSRLRPQHREVLAAASTFLRTVAAEDLIVFCSP